MSRKSLRNSLAAGAAVLLFLHSANGGAQGRGQTPAQLEPVKCWWQTDKGAVEVGERFALTLTCGIMEEDGTRVVPDLTELEPTALEIAPFEVIGGVRRQDLDTPHSRYLQYQYSVRLLDKGYFGRDAEIPSINVKYHIVSSGEGGEGREHLQVLPPLTVRILTLVPAKATDIRDSVAEDFGLIEARSRRAAVELVTATLMFGSAVVLLGLAFGRALVQRARIKQVARRPTSRKVLIAGALRSLRALETEVTSDGWTIERIARALAAIRLTAAVAIGHSVAQTALRDDEAPRDGQLVVRDGLLRPTSVVASAAVGPKALERYRTTRLRAGRSAAENDVLVGDLQESLEMLTSVRYGRSFQFDREALDGVLGKALEATKELRRNRRWSMSDASRETSHQELDSKAPWTR